MASSNYRRVPSSENANQAAGETQDTAVSSSFQVESAPSSQQQQQTQPLSVSATVGNNDDSNNNNNHSSGRSIAERFQDKIIAAVWVLVALCVGYWASVDYVLLDRNSAAIRPLLHIVAGLLGLNLVLVLYLTVYLPYVVGIKDSAAWEAYCPRVIPCMTLAGVLSFLLCIRATWPAWGFLAPLVISVECLGALFALHFVPWF